MTSLLSVRRATPAPNLQIALGWHVTQLGDGRELVWHNGGTGGYRSYMAYEPKSRTGVVVLSNVSEPGVDDIGMHLLDPETPLIAAPKKFSVITVDPKILESYVGRYQLAPTFILTVTREGDRLFVQATNQPKFELFGENERNFFLREVDAQLTFVVDGNGTATSAILHQNGADQTAKRVE